MSKEQVGNLDKKISVSMRRYEAKILQLQQELLNARIALAIHKEKGNEMSTLDKLKQTAARHVELIDARYFNHSHAACYICDGYIGLDEAIAEIEKLQQERLTEAIKLMEGATQFQKVSTERDDLKAELLGRVDKNVYSIALQRAIEHHCRGVLVPTEIAEKCPHYAAKLNDAHERREAAEAAKGEA